MNLTAKKILLAVVATSVISAGVAYKTGAIAKPDAGLVDKGDWLLEEDIRVESSAYIYNPNPVGLNLSNFSADYILKMNGVKLAEGTKHGVRIPENGNRTINFTTDLETDNIPAWWVTHLSRGEESQLMIPVEASLRVGPLPLSFSGYSYTDKIETDIEGSLSSSLSEIEGSYSRNLGPEIGLESNSFDIEVVNASARFGEVDRESTELVIPIEIRNRNSYPIPTPRLGGDLELNGVRIAEFDANDLEGAEDTNIPPGQTKEVTVRAEMSNERIDDWFQSHVRKGEKTDAELSVYFIFEVGDTSISIPSDDGMTCRFDFATMILVDQKADTDGFSGCSGIIRGDSQETGSGEDEEGLLEEDGSNSSTGDDSDSSGSLGGLL